VIRINLVPAERRRRFRGLDLSLPRLNLGLAISVGYTLALAGVGLYVMALWAQESRLAAQVARDRRELATLQAQLGQINQVREQAADMQKRLQVVQELTKNQGRSLLVLDAFLDAVPPDLWITALEERAATLKISGAAFSSTPVADLMANLRRGGKFLDVDITVARQDLNKSPAPVTFEVTCRFGS
jgi:Tfp pilus assembly protein PilN